MNDEESLLRAVLGQPNNQEMQAVFADWLEDLGQGGGTIYIWSVLDSEPDRAYRFAYGPTLVGVGTTFRAPHQAAKIISRCCSLAGFQSEAVDPALPGWRTLAAQRCLTIDSWAKVRALALAVPDCRRPGSRGGRYHHILWDRTTTLDAMWDSPEAEGCPALTTLIAAYQSLITLAGLLPKQLKQSQVS
jgi:uncharacterized protein (TIGR02996 family)